MKNKIFCFFIIFLAEQGSSYPLSSFLPNSSAIFIQELSSRLWKWQQENTPSVKTMNPLEKKYFERCISELQNWDTLLSPKQSLQHFSISYKVESNHKRKVSLFCAPASFNQEMKSIIKQIDKSPPLKTTDATFWGMKWTDGSDTDASTLSSFWIHNHSGTNAPNNRVPILTEIFLLPQQNKRKVTYTALETPSELSLEGKSFSKAVLSTIEINDSNKKYFGYRLKDYQGPNVFNPEIQEIIHKIANEFGFLPRYFNYEDNQNYEIFFP